MRQTFLKTLVELAERDRRILLLTGDLGYTVLEPFAQQFPNRFFNVGVAEQNLVGLATGLADAGFLPFLYSIATFASLRPYEFLRNGAVLQHLPVRVIGVGGGFEYGHAGPTHHGLEDVGVMRLQPSLVTLAPADYQQARSALLASWNLPHPVYYRLGKDDRNLVPGLDGRFALGAVQCIGSGRAVLLVAMGSISREVVAAADTLRAAGIDSTVAIVASLNPAPLEALQALLADFSLAVSVEAHYVTGGVGSLVAEAIAESRCTCRLIRCGVRQVPEGISGSQDYLHQRHGLAKAHIVETVQAALQSTVSPAKPAVVL